MENERLDKALKEAKNTERLLKNERLAKRYELYECREVERVKKIATFAARLNMLLRRREAFFFQKCLAVAGILGCLFAPKNNEGAFLPFSAIMLSAKVLLDEFANHSLLKIARKGYLAHFCEIYAPAVKEGKNTKWLRPSEATVEIKQKFKKEIDPKDLGTAITQICIKKHAKYLVECI